MRKILPSNAVVSVKSKNKLFNRFRASARARINRTAGAPSAYPTPVVRYNVSSLKSLRNNKFYLGKSADNKKSQKTYKETKMVGLPRDRFNNKQFGSQPKSNAVGRKL
jgi:hypothetical protein